jgi:short-subunit dehydrogenase
MPQTVVVTGASAGIGRATALAFAERGARVGLLARGRSGLDAAAAQVRERGGQALAIPTDMADPAQVEAAADVVEGAFGPIDVWVNVAFTTVFAPFKDIAVDEYKRATEVTYLGYVHGTKAALSRMLPRDQGTIVQVGSAMAYRALPLQSVYCGAKAAINAFTSSVRTELKHDRSNVHVTVVQMPAVNTPQFSWVRAKTSHRPQPVPPIYQPEFAARSVLFAAAHPSRKQYYVATSTLATVLGNRFGAGLIDRYLARTGYGSQQTSDELSEPRSGNLYEPLDDDGSDYGARGTFDAQAHERDPQLWFSRHPRLASVAVATGLLAAGGAWGLRLRSSSE